MSDREDRRRKRLEDRRGVRDKFVPPVKPLRQARVPKIDLYALQLFDLHIEAPRTPDEDVVYGITQGEAMDALGISKATYQKVLHHLRLLYGFDQGGLVSNPPTPERVDATGSKEWPVVLTEDLTEASPWMNRRMSSLGSQAQTFQAVVSQFTKRVDGRTAEGRNLVKLDRYLTRWLEDIEDVPILDE
jgi:hypothetical protein